MPPSPGRIVPSVLSVIVSPVIVLRLVAIPPVVGSSVVWVTPVVGVVVRVTSVVGAAVVRSTPVGRASANGGGAVVTPRFLAGRKGQADQSQAKDAKTWRDHLHLRSSMLRARLYHTPDHRSCAAPTKPRVRR